MSTNKKGLSLGKKGHETRQRLMAATLQLLKTNSPVEITAVSIAKKAKMSSATFYHYFPDVRGMLLALNQAAEADMSIVHDILDESWKKGELSVSDIAERVVHAFVTVWDRHRETLRYRNLEADRGDTGFDSIRLRTTVKVVERFSDYIYASYADDSDFTRTDAVAEASVLVAAMERLAATDLHVVNRGVGVEAMWSGMVRIVARTLAGGQLNNVESSQTDVKKQNAELSVKR